MTATSHNDDATREKVERALLAMDWHPSDNLKRLVLEVVQRVQGDLTGFAAANQRKKDRNLSMGLFTWLAIVEQEADKLSPGGQNALALLREDLEKLAR